MGSVIQVVVAPVPIVSICVGSLQIVSFLSDPRVTNLLLVRKKRETENVGVWLMITARRGRFFEEEGEACTRRRGSIDY